jgi:hypothetical protein
LSLLISSILVLRQRGFTSHWQNQGWSHEKGVYCTVDGRGAFGTRGFDSQGESVCTFAHTGQDSAQSRRAKPGQMPKSQRPWMSPPRQYSTFADVGSKGAWKPL